ncbi:hypothetical protein P2W68_17590 [Chryseobacterium arthrosphaerae]|uniref:hypothetical protein n=1 Tax=Chryseobacterium arthrosphaerae TaxID=651561 RepID=UPI0023E2272D|nr:hypothetical protein [Chryseobacterium arthrosphaerae]WES96649.1 hypothetical protein P2W68_17590 [Chryseobacterium arthrosphaerae]
MNSTFSCAEQPEIRSKQNQQDGELSDHNTDTISGEELYTIEWSDIENAEMDYENYLNDIENFFREDFENDILEKDV